MKQYGFFTDFRLEVNVQMIIMLVVLTINDFKPQDRCSRWDNKRAKQNYLNLHKKNAHETVKSLNLLNSRNRTRGNL